MTSEELANVARILDGAVSIRLLDWLVVNYSKKNCTAYLHKGRVVNLHADYKDCLLRFRRTRFDPFRRGERITFTHLSKEYVTTKAQLNFFKWCFENGVIEFAERNMHLIQRDMLNTLASSKILKRLNKVSRSKLNPDFYQVVTYHL